MGTRSTPSTTSETPINNLKTELIRLFKEEISKVTNKLDTLSSRLDHMEQSLKEALSSQGKMKKEISELSGRVKLMNDELNEVKSMSNQEEMIREVELRQMKKENIIIAGMPEATTGTLEEREAWDKREVEAILDELEVKKCDIKRVFRVGRNLQKHRLICVKLNDSLAKRNILQKAKILRNSTKFKHCFVNPDLTPMQRRFDKMLRDELKKQRENGQDVVIKNGRIIARDDSNKKPFFR